MTNGNIHYQKPGESMASFSNRVGVSEDNLKPVGTEGVRIAKPGSMMTYPAGLKVGELGRRSDGVVVKRVSPIKKNRLNRHREVSNKNMLKNRLIDSQRLSV